MIQACPSKNPEYSLHTPFLNNMAPKSATSANVQPTSTAPVPSRPSTPSKTGASSSPDALANERIDDQAVTATLVNGLEKNSRDQFETCM